MTSLRFQRYRPAPPQMMWVGKGTGPLAWVMTLGILAVATLMAWWMH